MPPGESPAGGATPRQRRGELLTQYGDISVMWFDGEWESIWTRELGAALADQCRALQPNMLGNNRVAPNRVGMDDARICPIGISERPSRTFRGASSSCCSS